VELNRSAQRLSRLLVLMSTLSETARPLTARELRAAIDGYGESDEAFRANFARDKRELRELGIEIDVVDLTDTDPPEAGYRISRSNYALRDPGLDPEETAALQLAVSLVRLGGGDDGLWKLGMAPAGGADAPGAELPGDPGLAVLFGAVAERRVTTFAYRGTTRTVDPYRLHFARGRWYLLARDRDKDEERQFRLDRIEGVPQVRGPSGFDPPSAELLGRVPDPWSIPDAPPVTARVAVDGPQAGLARAVLGDGAVVEDAGDRVVFELDVTHVDGFRSFVLGFLEHAEVLSPPELRAEVVTWLEAFR
jgi:proteasome accessory factor B